jgi:hypothetical protein
MRGVGEGQRPWDVRPEGVMTNATVGTVSQTRTGSIFHVTYKGDESEYMVRTDVPVLTYVLADKTLLKTGATVVAIAVTQPDGSLLTNRVTAEKDGSNLQCELGSSKRLVERYVSRLDRTTAEQHFCWRLPVRLLRKGPPGLPKGGLRTTSRVPKSNHSYFVVFLTCGEDRAV